MMFVVIERDGTKKFVDIFAVEDDFDVGELNKELAPLQMRAGLTEVSVGTLKSIVASCEAALADDDGG